MSLTFVVNIYQACSTGVKKAFPFIVLLLGGSAFAYSIWGTFQTLEWREFWNGIGKTLLVSGLFTLLVKSMQFSGIFKAEITKVIFEPKFLANRNDLSDYWEKVSQELFKNKFPNISQKLLKDIQGTYLPTKEVMYFDEVEHLIEIRYNPQDGMADVKRVIKMTGISSDKKQTHIHDYGSVMPFKSESNEVVFNSTIKVNGMNVTAKQMDHKQVIQGNTMVNTFKVKLTGSDKYVIERVENKTYNLNFDNIMYFSASKIYNKMKVDIHYPKDLLSIKLMKCGTIDNFAPEQQTAHSDRYHCKGIIYPQQGYYINIRPRNSN